MRWEDAWLEGQGNIVSRLLPPRDLGSDVHTTQAAVLYTHLTGMCAGAG